MMCGLGRLTGLLAMLALAACVTQTAGLQSGPASVLQAMPSETRGRVAQTVAMIDRSAIGSIVADAMAAEKGKLRGELDKRHGVASQNTAECMTKVVDPSFQLGIDYLKLELARLLTEHFSDAELATLGELFRSREGAIALRSAMDNKPIPQDAAIAVIAYRDRINPERMMSFANLMDVEKPRVIQSITSEVLKTMKKTVPPQTLRDCDIPSVTGGVA